MYSTGQSIHPKYWDKVNQRADISKAPKNILGFQEDLDDINTILDLYASEFKKIYRTSVIDGQGPSLETIRQGLDERFRPNVIHKDGLTFFSFVEGFIKKVSRRPVTLKGYTTTLNHLRAFQKQYRRKIDFDTVDMDFYYAFVKYFNNKDYTTNTIGKNIKNIKVFMGKATERKINTNLAFLSKEFGIPHEDTDQIYLREDEILQLYEQELSGNLEKSRDLFVAACFTGLRFADLNQIHQDNVIEQGTQLRVKTQKTGEIVNIPLHWIVKELLKKYGGYLPKPFSNQKMNVHLKKIGEKAEFDEQIPIAKTKGGRRTIDNYKKHELISVHTARRSFATNMYLADVPTISIMKITGHKTERAFLKYIRMSGQENAAKLVNHPFFHKEL